MRRTIAAPGRGIPRGHATPERDTHYAILTQSAASCAEPRTRFAIERRKTEAGGKKNEATMIYDKALEHLVRKCDTEIVTGRRRIQMARGLAAIAAAAIACAATALPAQAPTAGATGTYHISPGDQLDIYVWGDERLQRSLTVLPDGTFAFPLAGTVNAAGKVPTAVEAELSKLLAGQYKGVPPQVTVSVKAATGMQISVIGKVKAPGAFSPPRYVSALDALALAGGPTDFADLGNIIILRHGTNGRTQVLRTRLGNILKGKPSDSDLSADGVPQLQAGDTVVVP